MSVLPAQLKKALHRLIGAPPHLTDEEAAYRRLASKGWRPASINDVGAYQGEWTRMVRGIFPGIPVLMVEAQKAKAAGLEALCSELGGVSLASAVLAADAGEEVTFYEMETGSSYFPERSNAPRTATTYLTRTLDEVAEAFEGPLFLKVDVQGAELKVLAGGLQTLKRSEVVQLEVPFVSYNEGAPTLLEIILFMNERDFIPIDVSGFSRPNGIDLVQADFLFVRRDSTIRPDFIWFKQFSRK
jgi:FkbM family methyltransferase